MIEYEPFLNQILDGYRSNYNVALCKPGDELVASAELHMTQGQHVIFKEFTMWQADDDEIKRAYDDGFPRIKLDHVSFRHQHMCTRLVALFLYDDADEEALKAIRKCKIYHSFQFSLTGWMEMHTAGVSLTDGSVVSNRYGRETAKFLKMHVEHYAKHVESKN